MTPRSVVIAIGSKPVKAVKAGEMKLPNKAIPGRRFYR